jgi:hypothetical protein
VNRGDDLTDLFAEPPASPAQPVEYRQGIVTVWDAGTAANTVQVGGAVFDNLPVLTASVAHIAEGSVVALVTAGPSWMILGPITDPA